ncbi:MAG: hypothetical protein ACJ74Y_16780 [Bryobacteraceae bacterium]
MPSLALARRLGRSSTDAAGQRLRPALCGSFLTELPAQLAAKIFYNAPKARVSDDWVRLVNELSFLRSLSFSPPGLKSTDLIPDVAIGPSKGHLLITDRYPKFLRHQLIELGYLKSAHSSTSDSVVFNAHPRLTGKLSSDRLVGYSNVDGFGAATPGKLPVINVCPGFRNGILPQATKASGLQHPSPPRACSRTNSWEDLRKSTVRLTYRAAR